MSSLVFILTLLPFIAVIIWQRRKIEDLREGQRSWRQIAIDKGNQFDSLKLTYESGGQKLSVITKAFAGLSVQYREREQRLQSASAEAAERGRELAIVAGALTRTQQALHQVTSDPQALQRFQQSREGFMREIEGLSS